MTRLLVERGEQGGATSDPADACSSPSQRGSTGSAPAREVAQIGAVLGRDFTYLLLRDVAEAR